MQPLSRIFSAETIDQLKESRALIITGRIVQIFFIIFILFYLGRELSDIGWQQVWNSLPTNVSYYIFFLCWFFAIPIAELWVYRMMWGFTLSKHFAIFVRKRVYNLAILSYSGEAILAIWARQTLPLRGRVIFSTIKDSNILSGLASNCLTVIFLLLFIVTGQLETITDTNPDFGTYLIFAALIGGILIPMVLRFRGKIISLPGPLARNVFLVHITRNIAMLAFQAGMWAVVLPGIPTVTWLLFLTAQLVLTRIPFLPNTDLIYLGLGLTLAKYLEAPEAVVAGMFVAAGALSQLFNLIAYIGTSLPTFKKRKDKKQYFLSANAHTIQENIPPLSTPTTKV